MTSLGLGKGDPFAPTFAVRVQGVELEYGVTQFIESVEYESADGIADIARVRAVNPDFVISNAKVFQPGNEMDIYMGYGDGDLRHIGRVVITKQTPNFPQSGMPTIQVVGYTRDSRMMDNEPEQPKKKGGKGGRLFKDVKFSDAVEERTGDYDMTPDIDPTEDPPHNFIQRPGISDYEFVRGLSNITGYYFWVDGQDTGEWTLHFKKPGSLKDFQDKQYTFIYNQGNFSSLLTFTPELLIKGAATKIAAVVKDVKTGAVYRAEVEEENNASPDIDATGDVTGEVGGEVTTASDIKLFIGDFSFNIVTNRRFQSNAEVTQWAQQWFRRHRENFVLSRGRVIGAQEVMARQVHLLGGVGDTFEGEYYFTKVKHICSKTQGYVIDFAARKVVP